METDRARDLEGDNLDGTPSSDSPPASGAAMLSLNPSEGFFLGLVGREKELGSVPDWDSIFERGLRWHL